MKRPENLLLDESTLRQHREFFAEIHGLKYFRDHYDEMMTLVGEPGGGLNDAQQAIVLLKHLHPGNFEQIAFAHKHLHAYVTRSLASDGRCAADFLGIVDALGWCLYEMGLKYEGGEWVEDPDHYRRRWRAA